MAGRVLNFSRTHAHHSTARKWQERGWLWLLATAVCMYVCINQICRRVFRHIYIHTPTYHTHVWLPNRLGGVVAASRVWVEGQFITSVDECVRHRQLLVYKTLQFFFSLIPVLVYFVFCLWVNKISHFGRLSLFAPLVEPQIANTLAAYVICQMCFWLKYLSSA